jgi:RNA polymerase sigma-70 factor (ECF subfamily)
MTAAHTFEACRSRLTAVAYGMLGDRGEAEDAVQEAWLRFAAAPEATRNAEAWLVTVTTRIAIDRLRSAQARRETYVGPWLPEPYVREMSEPDPADVVAEAEQLSLALLTALERLNPVERAVFLLRDVFDLDYDEIADAVGKTPANCRQVASRARDRVGEPARHRRVAPEEQQRVLAAFIAAVTAGDVAGLMALLAADANTYSDGGGVVPAARKVIFGADRTARLIVGLHRKAAGQVEYSLVRVNGDPGLRIDGPGEFRTVLALEIADGQIANVRVLSNPHKLTRLDGLTGLG